MFFNPFAGDRRKGGNFMEPFTESLPNITAAQIELNMTGRYEKLMADVAAVVNAARPMHLLDDTDRKVADLFKDFEKELYEVAMQTKMDAAEAAPPPSAPRRAKARAAKKR